MAETPTQVLAEFIRRLNAGRYEDALALYAYDPLAADGITLDELRAHVDRRVTRGRTVVAVDGVREEPLDDAHGHVRATVRIRYADGAERTADLLLRPAGGAWRVTSHGSLL